MKTTAILIVSSLMLLIFAGCKKKEQPPNISFIIAGDTSGPYIHQVNLNKAISENSSAYIIIDNIKMAYLHYFFVHVDPVVVDYGDAIDSLSNAAYICVDSKGYPIVLHTGDTINNLLNWSNQSDLILTYGGFIQPGSNTTFQEGNWWNIPDGYLGFKIIKNSQTLWGWARLQSKSGLSIRDFAYTEY